MFPVDNPKSYTLSGGGHAHLQVVKALHAQARPSWLHVTLLDAQRLANYSGMVPGCVAGFYRPEQTQLALEPLADWAGTTFVHGRVVDIDWKAKQLSYVVDADASGGSEKEDEDDDVDRAPSQTTGPSSNARHHNTLSFDVLSIDIGSAARDWDTVPGTGSHTIPTRPIGRLIDRLEQARQELLDQASSSAGETGNSDGIPPVTTQLLVVGGGAAGLELALSITTRWKPSFPSMTCTLLNAGSQLLPQETSSAARRQLDFLMTEKGIQVRNNCLVQRVLERAVEVIVQDPDDETPKPAVVPFTHCIWAAGAGPTALALHLQQKGRVDPQQQPPPLAMTPDGWIRMHPTLQSISHPFVFAAGDCASVDGPNGTTPKAGVYAVRSGPILIENLTRYLDYLHENGSSRREPPPLVPYEPQDDFLKLLVCGDREALGFRFGMALRGRWVWKLKDHIDQSFMNLFDPAHLPPAPRKDAVEAIAPKYDTSQYDAAADSLPAELPAPQQAVKLLHRQDDGVDYLMAWKVLRTMASDALYRDAVVELYRVQFEAAEREQQLVTSKVCG